MKTERIKNKINNLPIYIFIDELIHNPHRINDNKLLLTFIFIDADYKLDRR